MSENDTSIPLKKDTRDKLKTFGTKGESYNVLLNRLVNRHLDLTLEEVEALLALSKAMDDCDDDQFMMNVISGSQKLYELMVRMKKEV